MKVIFENHVYGLIEVEQTQGQEGLAYFRHDDYEAPVAIDGSFKSQWSVPFRVFWPTVFGQEARLEVTTPRLIARAKVS